MQVTSILTPLIQKEIPDLLSWIRYAPPPCKPEMISSLRWFLSMDKTWDDEEKKRIEAYIQNSSFAGINIIFISIGLSDEESVYLRDLPRDASCSLELGSKNGPNQQFFRSLEIICTLSGIQAEDSVILLETDAIPVKEYWLDSLNCLLSDCPSFVIAGSNYKGRSPLSDAIKDHLNGNAIYGVSHTEFNDFLSGWRNLLRCCTKLRHWIAYDVAIPWIKYYLPQLRDKISHEDKQLIETTISTYESLSVNLSDAIINSSGDYEVKNEFIDLSLCNDKVLVWHSRPLSKTISWSLTHNGLDTDTLSKKTLLNRRICALNRSGILAYFEVNDPSSFSPEITNYLLTTQSCLRDSSLKNLFLSCLTTFFD